MKEKKIAYEPMPITPERKAELVAKGFTIVDERFDPDRKVEAADKPAPKKSAGKNAADKPAD